MQISPTRKSRTFRLTAITIANLELLSKALNTNKTGVLETAISQLLNQHVPQSVT